METNKATEEGDGMESGQKYTDWNSPWETMRGLTTALGNTWPSLKEGENRKLAKLTRRTFKIVPQNARHGHIPYAVIILACVERHVGGGLGLDPGSADADCGHCGILRIHESASPYWYLVFAPSMAGEAPSESLDRGLSKKQSQMTRRVVFRLQYANREDSKNGLGDVEALLVTQRNHDEINKGCMDVSETCITGEQ
ncbi:hypothetical protein P154DRAFT_524700 [Amniculicola lignicola CBS 123094]|uniref:Uncharacterized protein n=1 Tax=Amniculicola lignicola CBS 123094 TaxID=1392246 RepID=A0A6A5WBZ7_9PLEO|nr:hypothetical protein P154DRAFT_524700 [Amniculicola lignicola CBS 123094]